MKTAQIRGLLPSVFQGAADRGTPLNAILEVMETMHAPSEALLDHIDIFFDPYRAPDAFVPYIASWVDLSGILDCPRSRDISSICSITTGIGRLREVTAAAVTLSKWRGTRKGLLLFLETATGLDGFTIEEAAVGSDGKVIPFHLRITAPAASVEHRTLIKRIIEMEKPAYVTYDLDFAPPVGLEPTTK